MSKAKWIVAFFAALLLPGAVSAAACSNGVSQGAACSHIEFRGFLSPADMAATGESLNDIWGWVDPSTGEEYAIVGMHDGTAFVRLDATGNPEFLGRLRASDGDSPIRKSSATLQGKRCDDESCGERNSAWRDVKVFDHYAYIVSEANGHGVQIFDLHALRTLTGSAPNNSLPQTGFYDGVGHAHNIFINEDSARAYVVGHSNIGIAGGLHVLDLEAPLNPVLLADLSGDGYTHDVQCVIYAGPDPDIAANSELCFASNEDTLTIWNVTDPDNARILSRTSYSQAAYTHQGWLSEDQRYFFLNDELDEQYTGSRTHMRVFDVQDVDAPELATDYYSPTLAIDHNNYVYGRWLYQSNYAAGLRILDVLDPRNPVEAAYFDPQPTDAADFYGTWSNYTFPSGLVAFTDIDEGLYVVRPTLSEIGTAPDLITTLQLDATDAEVEGAVNGNMTLEAGAAADASDVLVTLHLPGGAKFVSVVEPTGWTCNSTDERVVLCRAATVSSASDSVFEFSLTSSRSAAVEVIAMAYANEADAAPADNLDSGSINFTGTAVATPAAGGGGGSLLWLLLAVTSLGGLRSTTVRR